MASSEVRKDAIFSECGKYRYQLSRLWDDGLPFAMCIGLNPSTANADTDDPTIRRLTSLMQRKGYGGFYMTNLFALISPYPEDLRVCPDPVKDNDLWLMHTSERCDDVIFCWGNFPMAQYRAKKVIPMFPKALCFGTNANGSPKHPLYLGKDTMLTDFKL
jgi:hypothetical protein